MLIFLAMNGATLRRSQKEIEEVIVAVAAKEMSKEAFFAWVEESISASDI